MSLRLVFQFSGINFLVIVANFCSVKSSLLLRIYCFSANLLSETSNLLSLKRKKPSQILDLQRLMQYCLYPERGSNPHAFQHRCLRPTCLPIPTSGRKAVAKVIVFFGFCKLISKNFADRYKISNFAVINDKRQKAKDKRLSATKILAIMTIFRLSTFDFSQKISSWHSKTDSHRNRL